MRKKEETRTLNNDKIFQFIRMKWMAVTHTKHGEIGQIHPKTPNGENAIFKDIKKVPNWRSKERPRQTIGESHSLHQGLSYAAFIRSGWDNGCIKWYSPMKT